MKYYISIIALFFCSIVFAQKNTYRVISIDSLNDQYIIKIQKLNSIKTTNIYSFKDLVKGNKGNIIKVNQIYKFTFTHRYIFGSPELQKDSNGNVIYVNTKKCGFKKDNKDASYSVFELIGLSYSSNSN